jgi:hypothetical protein
VSKNCRRKDTTGQSSFNGFLTRKRWEGLLKHNFPLCQLGTRVDSITPAWANSIVPVGTHSMAFQMEHIHFLIRHAPARLVDAVMEKSPYLQACCGRRPADVAQHSIPCPQGFPRPIEADLTEQAMLNRIPLRAAGRIVAHHHRQAQPVTDLCLQLMFPLPRATAIAAASIGQNEELVSLGKAPHPSVSHQRAIATTANCGVSADEPT